MMKNIKKLICLSLILSINFNVYAAVSGNDGSAYVTKSEFDALVNTFNEQMDSYESSVISKIDGAIANYLNSLSNEVTTNLNVGYLGAVSSDVSSITMQPSSGLGYAGGTPTVYLSGVFGSDYTNSYSSTYRTKLTYSGSANGARRFISQEGSKYRWVGYTSNYMETHDINWALAGSGADTGFSSSGNYFYCFGSSSFSTTSPTTNPSWASYLKWRFGDTNTSWGIFSASSAVVNTTFNTYTVKNKFDLVYSKYGTSSANNMRCFMEGNPNNRYFAGAGITYANFTGGASKSSMWYGIIIPTYNRYTGSTTYYYSWNPGYSNNNFFTCGFEPGITNWNNVLCADKTTYEYKDIDGIKKTLSDYSMVDGAVFGAVKKGGRYTWPVEFVGTNDTTLWLKYDKFADAPVTADCIEVSVDGGPLYKSATIKNGKGTITFTAPENGILFFKWTSGRSMKVAESLNVQEVAEDE